MSTDAEEKVAEHYARDGLLDGLLSAARMAGHDVDTLGPDALAGADEFHLGGRVATVELARHLPTDGAELLDVGCGIGGPARALCRLNRANVTGVDLTPAFIDAANELSRRVGLAERTRFAVGNATALPFGDASFDGVSLIHVGMNIADKATLVRELARVLRPSGTLVVYDVMRRSDGLLQYPLPWATTADTSFLADSETYTTAIEATGLSVAETIDHTDMVLDLVAELAQNPPPVHLGHLMGPRWPTLFGNLLDALKRGLVAPVLLVARR